VVAVLPAAVLVSPGDQLWFDPNLSAVRPPLSGDCASPRSLPSYCLGTPLCLSVSLSLSLSLSLCLCRPFQVEHIVGDARKQFFLSLMITSENFGSFFGPIWGALSDAAVGSDGRRRRRPIIVFGQCLFVGACVLMASAESFSVLLLSYMLFTFTATLSGAPYVVTNTTVPLEQRGMYNAMWSYQSLLMGFITSGLGAAVGENYLSQSGAYAISYAVALFPTLPIGAQTHTHDTALACHNPSVATSTVELK
jgi:MFS family permease